MFHGVTMRAQQLEFSLIVLALILSNDEARPEPFKVQTTKYPEIESLCVNRQYSNLRRTFRPAEHIG